MKKISKIILEGACTLAVIGVAGIIAYFSDTVKVTNYTTLGIVDIDLSEYMIDDKGNKVAWEDKVDVVPGEKISKIPEIKAVKGSADCYIRAKVELFCQDENLQKSSEMLTLDNLNVNEKEWYYCKNDGYFYYTKILTDESEPIQLFSQVEIPSSLNNTWSLQQLQIDVTVDAIQSKNFEPNFEENSEEPWPDITEDDIEECIYPEHIKYENELNNKNEDEISEGDTLESKTQEGEKNEQLNAKDSESTNEDA